MNEFNINHRKDKEIHEAYDPEKLESLKKKLLLLAQNGSAKRFSISIDGELIVNITDDPGQFSDFLAFADDTSEIIEVKIYFGDSFKGNRYIFHLNPDKLQQVQAANQNSLNGLNQSGGLSGAEAKAMIEDALQKNNLEHEITRLKTELERRTDALKRLNEKNKKVKKKIQAPPPMSLDKIVSAINGLGQIALLLKDPELLKQVTNQIPSNQPINGSPPPNIPEVELADEKTKSETLFEQFKQQFNDDELEKILASGYLVKKEYERKQNSQPNEQPTEETDEHD